MKCVSEITAKCPHIYLIYVCLLETAGLIILTHLQSQDLNIHYIIQRGATVDILTDLICSFLYSHETNLDNYQVILVKISAGINNLLHRENVLSDISPQQFIDKLLFF